MTLTKIYLDIDGVLISKHNQIPVTGSFDLLYLITNYFDPFWLTTQCKGSTEQTLSYLSKFFNAEFLTLASKIKPTVWDALKTEAIDFSSSFFWIDDEPLLSEKTILQENNCLERLIIPDFSVTKNLFPVIALLNKNLTP